MLRLQNLVNSLVVIIINYAEAQTHEKYKLTEDPTELTSSLKGLIEQATKNYPDRKGVLLYILYIIDQITLATNDRKPLEQATEKKLNEELAIFLMKLNELSDINKNTQVELKYGNTIHFSYRFISFGSVRNWVTSNAKLSQLGNIIKDSSILDVGFNINFKDKLADYIKEIFSEYKQKTDKLLKMNAQQLNAEKLEQEIQEITAKCSRLESENTQLSTINKELESENRSLKAEKTKPGLTTEGFRGQFMTPASLNLYVGNHPNSIFSRIGLNTPLSANPAAGTGMSFGSQTKSE